MPPSARQTPSPTTLQQVHSPATEQATTFSRSRQRQQHCPSIRPPNRRENQHKQEQ
ncbi:hypothetical protein BDY17DRAFT_300887 [Neohortaea acidophila]|uniref:Uncharacterized protein n=1 Tax=Neohortaea acidophila TaxID=245834 RepID=A0A6A6PND8_9PEZI|nr:uncharacterized protein BDY17DRAFT_300887 [Neohortaea acidophila]KAF2481211.1 hypothetical protein BDY17DRAFT_300887 [Neohortaea acidophila]